MIVQLFGTNKKSGNCYALAIRCFGILLLLNSLNCFSQSILPKSIDSLEKKVNLYGIKNQSPILFVHFDKNIYSTSENVWFTGYLLNVPDHSLYKTLAVTLINDNSRSVIQNDKFVMKGGLAFGNMVIPDTLTAGNYSFICFTNRLTNSNPDVIFTQAVTVKTSNKSPA